MDYNRDVAMIYTSKSKLFVSKGGTLRVTTGQMSDVKTANKKNLYIHTHISQQATALFICRKCISPISMELDKNRLAKASSS